MAENAATTTTTVTRRSNSSAPASPRGRSESRATTVNVNTQPRGRGGWNNRNNGNINNNGNNNNNNNNQRQNQKQDDVVTSAVKSLASVFEDPTTLIITLVTLAIAIDFTLNPNDNFILSLAKLVGPDTSLGTFLTKNSLRAIGILMLVPAAFNYTGTGANVKYLLAVGISIAVVVFPAMTYIGYFMASLFLRVYLRTKDKTLRLIMGVALSVVVVNYITKNTSDKYTIFPDTGTTTTKPAHTTTTRAPAVAPAAVIG